jgi:sec-independent protein translocase protein TatA
MIVILIIALIFFGPGKLSELGSGLGTGIREFKKALRDHEEETAQPALKRIEKAPPEEAQEAGRTGGSTAS